MHNIVSVFLDRLDERILVKVNKSKTPYHHFWRSSLSYLLVLGTTVISIFLTFWLLFQGLLNQSIFYYLGALVVLIISFFTSYQVILYTPTVIKNTIFIIGNSLVRLVKHYRRPNKDNLKQK
ncbi:hypothetical protein [Streptococcus sp. zg-JUN1979]|uniref:hypothetical protein n=1 Tax=Streptococcus sp. zg-JUN1979 TaxID=3391450 RepID=UPI0039A6B06B